MNKPMNNALNKPMNKALNKPMNKALNDLMNKALNDLMNNAIDNALVARGPYMATSGSPARGGPEYTRRARRSEGGG
jgi:hypothetical protein